MIPNEKVINCKVVELFEIYNFGLSFLHLRSFKNFEFQYVRT